MSFYNVNVYNLLAFFTFIDLRIDYCKADLGYNGNFFCFLCIYIYIMCSILIEVYFKLKKKIFSEILSKFNSLSIRLIIPLWTCRDDYSIFTPGDQHCGWGKVYMISKRIDIDRNYLQSQWTLSRGIYCVHADRIWSFE